MFKFFRGREVLDTTPVEVPLKLRRPLNLHEQIRDVVQSEDWKRRMNEQERETYEEANDFDVDDDVDFPLAPAEKLAMEAEELDNIAALKKERDQEREMMKQFDKFFKRGNHGKASDRQEYRRDRRRPGEDVQPGGIEFVEERPRGSRRDDSEGNPRRAGPRDS